MERALGWPGIALPAATNYSVQKDSSSLKTQKAVRNRNGLEPSSAHPVARKMH